MNMNRGHHLIFGDFNVVRWASKRFGTTFNHASANAFNRFIKDAQSWDVPLGGEFRVKDIRSSIVDTFLPSSDSATRWVKTVPIKVNILAWRTRLDRLSTRVNLITRGVNIDSSLCPGSCGLEWWRSWGVVWSSEECQETRKMELQVWREKGEGYSSFERGWTGEICLCNLHN
nr:RNA-directed DNA polymerase, eukaryota [Tanacetum cinerariifolium]